MLLNKICMLQSQLTSYLYPQQKLMPKDRDGATVIRDHDTAANPYHRALAHGRVCAENPCGIGFHQPPNHYSGAAT